MRTWIENFKPRMVIWKENAGGGCVIDEFMGDTVIVQPVCADRVFRVRRNMAIKKAGNDRVTLRWLGVDHR